MALLNEHQQAQRGRKILPFILAAVMSPLLVGQIVGALFAFVIFGTIIGKSSTIFTDLMIWLAGILAHLGVLGFFFFVLTDFQFDTAGFWKIGITLFIVNYIFITTLAKRGLIFNE
jgi:hypothetical protein